MPKRLKSEMKFLNEKNSLFALLCLCGCFAILAFKSNGKEKYVGTYFYHSVTRNGDLVFPIGTNDSLVLNKNHTFLYDIAAPNKHMSGKWKVLKVSKDSSPVQQALEFTYSPNGNKRIFNVYRNPQFSLSLREGQTYFNFK